MLRLPLRLIAVGLILGPLTGCSLFTTTVYRDKLITVPVQCPEPPQARPVTPLPVEPVAMVDRDGIPWVALTPKHYENLSLNSQEVLRYIKDKNAQVQYYRECIESHNRIEPGP